MTYSFPDFEPVIVPCPVLTVASCLAYRLLGYPHLFKNFPQFIVIHTVKGFSVVNEAEVDFFNSSCFFCDPADIGSALVPLPFLNPASTTEILDSGTAEA